MESPPRPSFHLVSDVHLETRPHTVCALVSLDVDAPATFLVPPPERWIGLLGFEPCANAAQTLLVLAGDVCPIRFHDGVLRRYLEVARRVYRRVLYVPGNHEYYENQLGLNDNGERTDHETLRTLLGTWVQTMPNVVLLDRATCTDRGVQYIGATLWSWVPPSAAHSVESGMNDYRAIRICDTATGRLRRATVADTNRWHCRDASYVAQELDKADNACLHAVVVVTHHAPLASGTSNPKYEASAARSHLHCAYGTDLGALLKLYGSSASKPDGGALLVWAFGHTHWHTDQVYEGVRIVSRPLGYRGERDMGPAWDGVVAWTGES